MLDIAVIRQDPEAIKRNCVNRNVKADVDRVVELDNDRKRLETDISGLNKRSNELSAQMPKVKNDPAARQVLVEEGKGIKAKVAELEARAKQVDADLHTAMLTLPNLTHPDAPIGQTADANRIVCKVGE